VDIGKHFFNAANLGKCQEMSKESKSYKALSI
jgi:hypothetical protein